MRFLAFALFCLASAAPALADHWAHEEITAKFKEVDAKLNALKDVEKHERHVDRRLNEINDDLRKLKTEVALMQAQMKMLEMTLTALRKDLADVGVRVDSGQPGTTKPAAGAATQNNIPASIAIRSQNLFPEGDLTMVAGTIANVSGAPLTHVLVEVTFLDERGSVLKKESIFTEPRVIGPGATANFRVTTPRDTRIKEHRLRIEAN